MKHFSNRSLLVLALAVSVGACDKTEPPLDVAPLPAPAPESLAVEASASVTFAEYAVSDIPAGGNCALDGVNGEPAESAVIAAGSQTLFSGWVTDADGEVPSEALLVLESAAKSYSAMLTAGGDRPDVAAALGTEAARLSGYNIIAVLGIEPGEYEAYIVFGGANAMKCVLNKQLVVTAA